MESVLEYSAPAPGIESERRQRQAIVMALYRKRLVHASHPSITVGEFEELLGVPKEEFEFSLWYLKEGLFIKRTDNGSHTILLKGVDLAETFPAS